MMKFDSCSLNLLAHLLTQSLTACVVRPSVVLIKDSVGTNYMLSREGTLPMLYPLQMHEPLLHMNLVNNGLSQWEWLIQCCKNKNYNSSFILAVVHMTERTYKLAAAKYVRTTVSNYYWSYAWTMNTFPGDFQIRMLFKLSSSDLTP